MAFKQLVFLLLVCIPGSVRGGAKCERPVVPNSDSISPTPLMDDGEEIKVTCNDGYSNGQSQSWTSVCKDGKIDPQVPLCYEEECKRPIIPHSNSTSSTPLLKDGEGIVVTCYDGYSNGHSQSSFTVCIDGVLMPPVPQCYANCYRPVVPHSDANSPTPVLHHGEFFTVTCDTGYSNGKTQSTISQCKNGYMIPPVLNCYANCVPRMIPHSDHSTQQPDVLNGQSTTIKCCKNFSMGPKTQSITLTCYDGELNDETVRCYENCQLVQIPINGNISEGSHPFFHNEEVRFQCSAEYNLVGETEIVCFDGSWSGYPPVCIREHQISWREIVLGVVIFVTSVIVIIAAVKVAVKRHKSRKPSNQEKQRIMDKVIGYGTEKHRFEMKEASTMESSSGDNWQEYDPPEQRKHKKRSIQTSSAGTRRMPPGSAARRNHQKASPANKAATPVEASDAVPDEKLTILAKYVPHEKYIELSEKLGIGFNPAKTILMSYSNDYRKAIRECLAIWKDKTRGSSAKLKDILDSAEIGGSLVQYIE